MNSPRRIIDRLLVIPLELLNLPLFFLAFTFSFYVNLWLYHTHVLHRDFVLNLSTYYFINEVHYPPGTQSNVAIWSLLTAFAWFIVPFIFFAIHIKRWGEWKDLDRWQKVRFVEAVDYKSALLLALLTTLPGLPFSYRGDMGWGLLASIAGGAFAAVYLFYGSDAPEPQSKVKRGTALVDEEIAKSRSGKADHRNNRTVRWGPLVLPDGEEHFCAIGAPGSGKTLTLAYLMQSVIEHYGIPGNDDFRLLMYDAKGDAYSWLRSLGVADADLKFLNPFDKRSVAWDIAKDVTTEGVAQEVAEILIPSEPGDANLFFTKAARDLFGAVLVALRYRTTKYAGHGTTWDLRDAILTLRYPKAMREILTACPMTAGYVDEYLDLDPRTLSGITATISTSVALLRPVAALWNRCEEKLCLQDWVMAKGVLILGGSEELVATINAINRVIFHRLTQLLLQRGDDSTNMRRTWVFIDELREAGKLDGLARLINKGRSKGIRVAVAFQDINGLRASYGDSAAVEFPNLCANKAFCKTTSGETAEWISTFNIGGAEVVEYQKGYKQDEPHEINISEHVVERSAVRKEELMNLPQARNGIVSAYIKADGIGTLRCTIDYFGRTPPLKKKEPQFESSDFLRRDDEDQRLLPWDDDDLQRLGLKRELLERAAKKPPGDVSDAENDDDDDDDDDFGRYAVRHL